MRTFCCEHKATALTDHQELVQLNHSILKKRFCYISFETKLTELSRVNDESPKPKEGLAQLSQQLRNLLQEIRKHKLFQMRP